MSKVSVGLATKLGLAKALLLTGLTIVLSLEHNQALLTGANKPAGLAAVLSLIAVVVIRGYQGAHIEGGSSSSPLPDALQALVAEAQGNVAAVKASPDGADGGHVAFAQPSSEAAEN